MKFYSTIFIVFLLMSCSLIEEKNCNPGNRWSKSTKAYLELKMWLKVYSDYFIRNEQSKQAKFINGYLKIVASLFQT